ncbi:LCP family protein [Nesterenkonia natronophila]|uniref:LytR family transcriptional regulator n=1 Tax=Nesterenkonia natronophila TaxID=2174932 RepID=A0A3A4F818_9MICC|nr:LCP family protein [Nesterenkonia natronophila]RJN31387.1 LytR family transcriptional regulator [Nesterenkonia natronophila]
MTAAGPADQFFVYDDDDSPRRTRRRGSRWILGGAALLVIMALLAAGIYLFSLQRSYGSNVTHFAEADPGSDSLGLAEDERPEETDATNVLLLGTDAGGGSGEDEDLPRVPGGGRSDTMMLIHIPESGDSVQVMSIPRDLWVEVPGGHGWHKVNAGLALGGDQGHWLARATVEDLLDVRIDHVTAVDLLGFVGLVEELGGVTVDSGYSEPFSTSEGYTFTPGEQFMDADQALSFVRHRSTFPDGDLQRIRNQHAFIRAVIEESASPSNLANPIQTNNMVSTFASHLITDPDLTASRAASLVWDARDATGDIQFATLPNGGSGTSPDGQWIWYQDTEAQAEISQAMQDGTLGDYLSD